MRITFGTPKYDMTVGVHNGSVWQRIRTPQKEDLLKTLEEPEANNWLEKAEFFDRIVSSFKGRGSIDKIETTTHQDEVYLQVKISGTGASLPIKIWIDPQTMHPSFQQEDMPDGQVRETKFSNYHSEQGIAVPFVSETSVDGVFTNRVVVESFSLNSGVLSSAFKKPEE